MTSSASSDRPFRTSVAVSAGARELWGLLAIVVVSACIAVFDLGGRPLWLDEAYSVWFSDRSFAFLWAEVPGFEMHPPLYYSLLKLWRSVFGDTEAALRGLSALAMVATVPAVYLLARILGGPRSGPQMALVASLLFAVWPVQVEYAQTVRMYAPMSCAIAWTLTGVAWLARHPEAACRPWWGLGTASADAAGGPSAPAWLTVAVGAALALWLHNMSLFFVASLGILGLLWLAGPQRWNRAFLANGFLAGVAALLLWSPHLPSLLQEVGHFSTGFWIHEPTLKSVLYTSVDLWVIPAAWSRYTALPLGLLAVAGLWVLGRNSGWQTATMLAAITALPVVLVAAASWLYEPMLLRRTLLWTSIGFIVALAAGVASVRPRLLRLVLLAVVLGLAAKGLADRHRSPVHEPWDQVVRLVGGEVAADDIVLVLPNSAALAFSYYARSADVARAVVPLPAPYPALGLANRYGVSNAGVPRIGEEDTIALAARIAGGGTVWLVTRNPGRVDPDGIVLETLRRERTLVSERALGGLMVYRFE